MRSRWSADTALVFGGALALFATTVTQFEARVTDLSALRIVNGDVPYRDFWTMYAPGSFTTLAVAFALFGRELFVSNLLGIATSAAGVAAYYRLVRSATGAPIAFLCAALVAAAFFGTGYHDGFTSYPPAFLLIVASVNVLTRSCTESAARWAIASGLLLGLATLFKHDVGGYATIAAGAAAIAGRQSTAPRWTPTLIVFAAAAAVIVAACAVLVALGAGSDAWNDLVRFPLTDFRYVRGEDFPILPRLGTTVVGSARGLMRWITFNLPLVAVLAGLLGLRWEWRRLDPAARCLTCFAIVAFAFHWIAAHVQMNTHAISLAAWGALVAAVGLRPLAERQVPARAAFAAAIAIWSASFVAEPGYRLVARAAGGLEWVNLPRLHGISSTHADAVWMRELSQAITEAGEADAPLLLLSERNDLNLFAESTPFWLTDRRPATRHHELHPGITDTEPVQRQMIAQLAAQPAPVVVREHRFSDDVIEAVERAIRVHVAVGARVIDEWIDRRYAPGPIFGMYEVMRARGSGEDPR